MYENNYPNNYHYESGNAYQSNPTASAMGSQPVKPEKKKKNGSGAGKKILVAICCGLCFGIFGGLGFQAVDTATEILKDAVGFEEKLETEAVQSEQKEETAKETVAETAIQ